MSSAGGHDPGSGPLPADLPITIDLWPRDEASGCWADMTRTFVGAGAVTEDVAKLRDIAREALEAAREAARPGVTGRALALYRALDGIEDGLKPLGVRQVTWLTSAAMASALRRSSVPSTRDRSSSPAAPAASTR